MADEKPRRRLSDVLRRLATTFLILAVAFGFPGLMFQLATPFKLGVLFGIAAVGCGVLRAIGEVWEK